MSPSTNDCYIVPPLLAKVLDAGDFAIRRERIRSFNFEVAHKSGICFTEAKISVEQMIIDAAKLLDDDAKKSIVLGAEERRPMVFVFCCGPVPNVLCSCPRFYSSVGMGPNAFHVGHPNAFHVGHQEFEQGKVRRMGSIPSSSPGFPEIIVCAFQDGFISSSAIIFHEASEKAVVLKVKGLGRDESRVKSEKIPGATGPENWGL